MIEQTITSAIVVGLASCYLASRAWKAWKGTVSGCGGGTCKSGCATTKPGLNRNGELIPPEQLVLRKKQPR